MTQTQRPKTGSTGCSFEPSVRPAGRPRPACRWSARIVRLLRLLGRSVDYRCRGVVRRDFPAVLRSAVGSYIDSEKFRYRQWTPALRPAGIEHRRIHDCRRAFASWAIAGGVQLFYLARIKGTSVAQIDAPTGTCYQTPRTTCVASSTASTSAVTD